MKFLHTADWHIGKKLHDRDLYEEQEYILNELVKQIDEHEPDFLIIAGDLYDKSVPSKEAIELLQKFLIKINIEKKLPIFAISGNHDNRERLRVGEAWFSRHNFYLHTTLEQSFNKISFNDADIYLLPYFEPYEAREYFEDNTLTSHHLATKKVVDKIYENLDKNKINILVAHTFVAGSENSTSDSEREISIASSSVGNISVGTVENVALDVFEKFDYVALGHLHNPNACLNERIKYSGSPLAYSFSEANQKKGTRLIEITKDTFVEKFLPLIPSRKLHNIVASYDEVTSKEFQNQFDTTNDFFSMELRGLEQITDPMPRLQEFYPNLLVLKAKEKKNNLAVEKFEKVLLKNPSELISNFYTEQQGEKLSDEQRKIVEKLIGEVME